MGSMTSDAVRTAPEPSLLAALAQAASVGHDPEPSLVRRLLGTFGDLASTAEAPPSGQPYSRRILHHDPAVEIMVARWGAGQVCAPHDHGGCSGFVTVLHGSFHEIRYHWEESELVAEDPVPRGRGCAYGFGPEVIHAMGATASGGVTLHVYAPLPQRMNVYDLSRREVLDLVGDFGAWIPAGAHPRTSFDLASPPS